RSATIGSTFAALRAGTKQANNPTTVKHNPTVTNVAGSVVLTSNNRVAISRVKTSAPPKPTVSPTRVIFNPSPTTIASTVRVVAPSATRTPISCVRCVTEYAITP